MRKRKMSKKVIMTGRGFFDSLWSGIKSVAGPVNDILKSTKAISTIGSLIPNAGAQTGAKIASQLGYGKKPRGRPKKRTMRGRGANNVLLV
jgi:hypothetical protein